MAPRIMVIWVLVLQALWIGVFAASTRYFKPPDKSKPAIARLERKLHLTERALSKLNITFGEYRDTVAAAGLRIAPDTPWTDSQREIASVLSDSQFKLVPEIPVWANRDFEKGRRLYIEGQYKEAIEVLDHFVARYSENPNLPKAAFLLTESYVELGEPEYALKPIELLVTHFPETEYAAYGLLRLGKIFSEQSRPEEAAEIFRIVTTEYAGSNAAALAKKNLKELPL